MKALCLFRRGYSKNVLNSVSKTVWETRCLSPRNKQLNIKSPPPPVCLGGNVHFTASVFKPQYAAIVILIVKQKVAIHLLTLSRIASFALAHIQT